MTEYKEKSIVNQKLQEKERQREIRTSTKKGSDSVQGLFVTDPK